MEIKLSAGFSFFKRRVANCTCHYNNDKCCKQGAQVANWRDPLGPGRMSCSCSGEQTGKDDGILMARKGQRCEVGHQGRLLGYHALWSMLWEPGVSLGENSLRPLVLVLVPG